MRTTTNIHMLMKGKADLVSVTSTLDDIDRERARTPALRAYANVDPLVVAQFLSDRMPWEVVKSDEAWQKIAPAMQALRNQIASHEGSSAASLYRPIPTDTPPEVAKKWGSLIHRHPQITDLSAAIEISEIVIAAKNHRAPDPALFRRESRTSTWADLDPANDQQNDAPMIQLVPDCAVGDNRPTGPGY